MKYNDKEFVCLLDVGFDVIRGKWKSIIICHLNDGPKRFLELQRITKGVSQKILTENLKALESESIIEKKIYPEIPPKVEYYLTPKGFELSSIIKNLEKWSMKYYKYKVNI
ncbi:MAG: winged helix-turn-helix transcriptional regulator [Sarcina sp.]